MAGHQAEVDELNFASVETNTIASNTLDDTLLMESKTDESVDLDTNTTKESIGKVMVNMAKNSKRRSPDVRSIRGENFEDVLNSVHVERNIGLETKQSTRIAS
jgi:hypothetical protein